MLGPALLAYLLGWAVLALLRALTVQRGGWSWAWHGGPRGRYKLEFTGWALVLEWRLPGILRSRSVVLPMVVLRSTSGGRKPRAASLSGAEEAGAGDEGEAAAGGDGLTLSVLLFWLGQAVMVLFLACNAWWTLRDSGIFVAAAAGGGESDGPGRRHRLLLAGTPGRFSLHVASRLRPMAFLLPSASASSEGGTADWRYVWCAALLALAAHEYGHARAARLEGVPVQRT